MEASMTAEDAASLVTLGGMTVLIGGPATRGVATLGSTAAVDGKKS